MHFQYLKDKSIQGITLISNKHSFLATDLIKRTTVTVACSFVAMLLYIYSILILYCQVFSFINTTGLLHSLLENRIPHAKKKTNCRFAFNRQHWRAPKSSLYTGSRQTLSINHPQNLAQCS